MTAMLKRIVNVVTGVEQVVEIAPDELASFAAPLPTERPRFVPLEFLDLFTEAEQLSVAAAAMSSAPVKLWYDRVLAASYITLDDPRVETGLTALVAAGLLSEERKLAVLAAMLESE